MSISMFTVPVLIDTNTKGKDLASQWVTVYDYGHQVLPAMSVTTFVLYMYASFKKRANGKTWRPFFLSGVTTVIMVPFTWQFMLATNDALFRANVRSNTGSEPTLSEVLQLVTWWRSLHFMRSYFPLIGAALGLLSTCNWLVF